MVYEKQQQVQKHSVLTLINLQDISLVLDQQPVKVVQLSVKIADIKFLLIDLEALTYSRG
jgi:hypothetical protein